MAALLWPVWFMIALYEIPAEAADVEGPAADSTGLLELGRIGVFQLLVRHRFLQGLLKKFRQFGAPYQYLPNLNTSAKE